MELYVIIPGRPPDLVLRVVDGKPVVVPPAPVDTALVQHQPQTIPSTR
jgi:hypothetical protein